MGEHAMQELLMVAGVVALLLFLVWMARRSGVST
jgi:hypothetical protein